MKKNSLSLGTFPSPEGQIFSDNLKGWCSERVPAAGNSSRRHISAAATPFYSDEKLDEMKDAETTMVSSRRDMATQMSPDNSSHSSPGPLSIVPVSESQSDNYPANKLEIREVQVEVDFEPVNVVKQRVVNDRIVDSRHQDVEHIPHGLCLESPLNALKLPIPYPHC
ncbi:hypothetical protein ACFE04_003099 [Oxalis oulophora]